MIRNDSEGGLGKAINGAFANDPKNLEKMNFFGLNSTERVKRLNEYKKKKEISREEVRQQNNQIRR